LKNLGFRVELAAKRVPLLKDHMVILRSAMVALLVLGGYSACAQQFTLPDAPSQHKFFDRQNSIAFGILAGLVAADSVTTQRLTNSGRAREANPLWRPMVRQGWLGQTAASGLGFASAVGVAYALHKTRHHKLERWANWLAVSIEGANDARNVFMDASLR
jgi:hypothetical protein